MEGVGVDLPVQDRLFLAWRLEPKEWSQVAAALSALKTQLGRSRVEHDFVSDDVIQIRFVIERLDAGRRALEEISGIPPNKRSQVEDELAAGNLC
jgi:hypothetical protein